MGPSFLSMLVFGVRMNGFLSKRCVYFPGFYLAAGSALGLSFLGVVACIDWKYFAMVLLCVLCGVLVLLLLASGVSTVASSARMSTPLPVHRMRMHSVPNGGSIAEGFCLSTIRVGCSLSTREFYASTCFQYDEPVTSM